MNNSLMAKLDTNQTRKREEGEGPGEDVQNLKPWGPPRDTNGGYQSQERWPEESRQEEPSAGSPVIIRKCDNRRSDIDPKAPKI